MRQYYRRAKAVIPQLIGRFGLSSALVIGGRLSVLLLYLVAARYGGPAEFGVLVFAMAAGQILSIVCSLGTAPASQLIIGEARGQGRPARIPSFIDLALVITLSVSLLGALLFAASAYFVTARWPGSSTGALLNATAIFLPVLAMSTLREYVARALELVAVAFVPRDIAWALASTLLIVLVPAVRTHMTVALAGMLAAIELPLWVALWRYARKQANGAPLPRRAYRRWMSRSAAMLVNLLAGLGFERIDVLVMGVMSPLAAAGVYGAATRAAPLISTSQRFIIPVITPKVAQAVARRNFPEAWREIKAGATVAACLAVPATLFMLVFAPQIMGLFGPAFASGAPVLRTLAAAHLVIALGSNFSVLIMIGQKPWVFARIIWSSLLVTAVLLPPAVYWLGPIGAAATMATGLISYNLRVVALSRHMVRAHRATA